MYLTASRTFLPVAGSKAAQGAIDAKNKFLSVINFSNVNPSTAAGSIPGGLSGGGLQEVVVGAQKHLPKSNAQTLSSIGGIVNKAGTIDPATGLKRAADGAKNVFNSVTGSIDPKAEGYRTSLMAQYVKNQKICSNGYRINKRTVVLPVTSVFLEPAYTKIYYTGECLPAPEKQAQTK